MPLLEVENLCLADSSTGKLLVKGVSFSVEKGDVLGIVGESGSGKSITALSILKLYPPGIKCTSGKVYFKGMSIYDMPESEVLKLRGKQISMILQDPLSALNPVLTIGEQVEEVLEVHSSLSKKQRKKRVLELLKEVGISDPELRARSYPHELSGGLRQRAMIAMALAGEPELLIADEPTTALDPTLQIQVLELLKNISQKKGLSLIFISHDLGVISYIAKHIVVLYKGEVLETGKVEAVLKEPLHPYTKLLIDSSIGLNKRPKSCQENLIFEEPSEGCVFYPRCVKRCEKGRKEKPPLIKVDETRSVRCFLYE